MSARLPMHPIDDRADARANDDRDQPGSPGGARLDASPHHDGPHQVGADAHLLEGLLAGLVDAVVVTDARGTVVRASASVLPLLGWAPGDLIGRNVNLLVPEPHHSAHDGYLERYLETGRTWILGTAREFDVVRRDGSTVACELCVSRIDLERGPPPDHPLSVGPLFCGTFRDISERRLAHAAVTHSEARFRAVFDHENELVLLLDDEGRVTDVNATALERTGRAREAVLGRTLSELALFVAPDGGDPRDIVRRVLAQSSEVGVATARIGVLVRPPVDDAWPVDARGPGIGEPRPAPLHRAGLTQDGPQRDRFVETPHELSARRIPSDLPEMPRTIVEVRDVSALVAAERRESSVLRSLARVGEEAAVLAHELRSPVSALELALKAVARNLGADERLLLDDLRARMRHLEDLLRRTLSFSRPLDLRVGAVAPAAAFGTALERESSPLTRSRLRPTIHIGPATPALAADPRALEDLLANLIRNAAEAQPRGGRLRLEAAPLGPSAVRLVIEDGGPGIPVAAREEVFRPFQTSKSEGTGLGLALVRKIAEEHGATITLTDAAAGGLRILLDWPAAASPLPPISAR
ncbi:MAG: PAS domain S-box protein [Planctomycetota bacterium]